VGKKTIFRAEYSEELKNGAPAHEILWEKKGEKKKPAGLAITQQSATIRI